MVTATSATSATPLACLPVRAGCLQVTGDSQVPCPPTVSPLPRPKFSGCAASDLLRWQEGPPPPYGTPTPILGHIWSSYDGPLFWAIAYEAPLSMLSACSPFSSPPLACLGTTTKSGVEPAVLLGTAPGRGTTSPASSNEQSSSTISARTSSIST